MQIPDKRTTILIAELFKGFDDPTRVQILSSLIGREMCVNEIAEAAELSQPKSSLNYNIRKNANELV